MKNREELQTLANLLQTRLALIADHDFRDRSPGEHLEQLQKVSEQIEAWHQSHADTTPPRLDHFLKQASYQKALEWIGQEIPSQGLNPVPFQAKSSSIAGAAFQRSPDQAGEF